MPSARPLSQLIAGFAALALLLAACAPPAAPQPTEAPAVTPAPTPTVNPEQAVTSPPDLGTAEPDPYATDPAVASWAPQPGDDALDRGSVFLDVTDVLLLESYPVQVQLRLEGNRPTPCHQLRVAVAPPDKRNQIVVEVYTLTDPAQACTQQLAPFTESIGLGSYPSGTYSVLVNGEPAAEFTV